MVDVAEVLARRKGWSRYSEEELAELAERKPYSPPTFVYREATDGFWWCNTHKREATHVCEGSGGEPQRCCKPGLGGIMIPCSAVDLTGQVADAGNG